LISIDSEVQWIPSWSNRFNSPRIYTQCYKTRCWFICFRRVR